MSAITTPESSVQKRATMQRFLPGLLIATASVIAIVLLTTDILDRNYVATLEDTYTVTRIIAALTTLGATWAIINSIRTMQAGVPILRWRISPTLVGMPAGLAFFAVLLAALNATSEYTDSLSQLPMQSAARVVESIIPLAIGVLAAMIFSPPDEPGIEIQLAAPRPIGWIMIERLLPVIAALSLVGCVGVGMQIALFDTLDAPYVLFARWIAPSIFAAGLGMYVTIRSRNLAFGVTMSAMMWFMTSFFTNLLLPGAIMPFPLNYIQPYVWVINPYLQPEQLPIADFWLNRLCVTSIGMALLTLTLYSLRDSEFVLLGIQNKHSTAKEG
jgi:hypothetical protein